MAKILKEGLDYLDLKGQITPEMSVDEYQAQMGSDDEIITCAFTVKGNQPANDLVDWLEKGYDWILDSQVSSGEITSGKYLVFVEINRRLKAPERIIEMLEDLETLTGQLLEEWSIIIDGNKHQANVESIKSVMCLSPQAYREKNDMKIGDDTSDEPSDEPSDDKKYEKELSEMRDAAGLPHTPSTKKPDALLRNFLAKAGL